MHVFTVVLIEQPPLGCSHRSCSRPCPTVPHLQQALPQEREAPQTDESTKRVGTEGCGCGGAAGRCRSGSTILRMIS